MAERGRSFSHLTPAPSSARRSAFRREDDHYYQPNRRESARGRRAVYLDPLRSAIDRPLAHYRPSASHPPPRRLRLIECAPGASRAKNARLSQSDSLPSQRAASVQTLTKIENGAAKTKVWQPKPLTRPISNPKPSVVGQTRGETNRPRDAGKAEPTSVIEGKGNDPCAALFDESEVDWNSSLPMAPPGATLSRRKLPSSDSSSREPAIPTTELDFPPPSKGLATSPDPSTRAETTKKKRLLPIRRKPPVTLTTGPSSSALPRIDAIDLTLSPVIRKTEVALPEQDAETNLPALEKGGESKIEISRDEDSLECAGVEKRHRPESLQDIARKKQRTQSEEKQDFEEDLLDLDLKRDEEKLDFQSVFNAHMDHHTRRLVGTANDGRPLSEEDLCIRWTAGAVDLLDFHDYLVKRQDAFIAEFSRAPQKADVFVSTERPLARISVNDCERLYDCVRSLAEESLRKAERALRQRERLRALAEHVCARLNVTVDAELTDMPASGGTERQQLAREAASFELVIQPDICVYLVNAVDEKCGRREIKRGELSLAKVEDDSLVAHALLCNISWLCSRPVTITAASFAKEYVVSGLRGSVNARKLIRWLNGEAWGCRIGFTAIGRQKATPAKESFG